MTDIHEFDDIRPYIEGEMKPAFESLLVDRRFTKMLKGFIPLPLSWTKAFLRLLFIGIKTPQDFQVRYMKAVVRYVLHKCSSGYSCHFDESLKKDGSYTFVSNHRDIVLDSAILDFLLVKHKFAKTVEIAIGNNLLIYPWIETLVRMNKSFIVRRGLSIKETMLSSIHMSKYMHFAINSKHENIWMAQREGRAKDSNDLTQDSILKMLVLGGPTEGKTTADIIANLKDMHIVPLAISYEYDPCDYLKAMEFQQKRDIPGWKKSKQDDLDNMKIGILGKKGHVHYETAPCINDWLDTIDVNTPKTELYTMIAQHIDKEIHSHYRLYPGNYIAAGMEATDKDKAKFNAYIESKLAQINIEKPDIPYLKERIMTMYANPALNQVKALKK